MATHRDWIEDFGFWRVPVEVRLPGDVVAWRVWGGTSGEGLSPTAKGLFLTAERPTSRSHAERTLAVMEHGNACRRVSRYRILAGTPVHVGIVHPGEADAVLPGIPGVQIFVDRLHCDRVRREGASEALVDDLPGVAVVRRWVPAGRSDA